jgi:hypothetical protein
VLGIDLVQVTADKPVLVQRAHTSQVGVVLEVVFKVRKSARPVIWIFKNYLILVPVSLTDQSGVVPSFNRAPGKFVAAVAKPHPVSGTLKLVRVLRLAQLETRRVHGVDVAEGIAELVHLRTIPAAT